jgi:hypothetical protein
MRKNETSTTPLGVRSNAGLGLAITGAVMYQTKLEPTAITWMDFTSLIIGDGVLVCTYGGKAKIIALEDLVRVGCRLNSPSVANILGCDLGANN